MLACHSAPRPGPSTRNGDHPSGDRQSILVASAGGSLATVDTGNHAFAWRLPGVLAGALMAGLIFLLVRILFRRREIAVIAAILVLVDGMLFVQSRIGMNDVYVGLVHRRRLHPVRPALDGPLAQSLGVLGRACRSIGVLLGLGLASKWVAAVCDRRRSAILILGRSALGPDAADPRADRS